MRTTPPFRADHVGSLLRPAELLAARDDFAAGRIGPDHLRAVEDAAIAEAVAMQSDVGLQSATDGEFRRASWHMDFIYQLGGISKAPGNLAVHFRNADGEIECTPAALHIGSKIHLSRTIFDDDFRYLQSAVSGATPKLTIPSPNMVHYRGGPASIDPAVYPEMDEFWADLAAAYNDEVQRLAGAGLHLPAARRHQPRLPQRPGAASGDRAARRGRRAPAPALHPPGQRRDRRAARWT